MADVRQPIARSRAHGLLARILEAPELPDAVRRLTPSALGALIERVGLEDAGEIVALATIEQLAAVFDADLWRNERPGEEERFDAARFALWLEILQEAGDEVVAGRLAELPEELVTLALHRLVLVLDMDALVAEMTGSPDRDEVDRVEKALAGCLCEELDRFRIIARRHDGWDAALSAILALDRDRHDLVERVLERCAAMGAEHVEESGGLFEVLSSAEMLEGDVAAEREDRRAAVGYVAPADAAAFLKLARRNPGDRAERDPLTRAYFRELARVPAVAGAPPPAARPSEDGLAGLLRAEGVLPAAGEARRLPAAAAARRERLVVRALRRLAEADRATFAARSEEIAYLANVLVAGASSRSGRLRPAEALDAAIAAIDLGLELALGKPAPGKRRADPLPAAVAALRETGADLLFRRAWHALHAELAGPAGEVAAAAILDALVAR